MTLAPGTRLGPYELVGQIGAGGMGEVWKAKDPKLDRFVAIKVLPADFTEDGDRLKRFRLEARALASLSHPNVVQVFEVGEHQGAPFLVMELLEGETLRERLHGKALPAKRAAELARDVAQGLAAAHGKGILHRDLKPENIFVTRDGRVKVLDFGLAKTRGAATDSKVETQAFAAISEPGQVVGTSGYMSPEQVRGETVDARSDLFSLGIVLWEMVTGRKPFTGDSAIEVMHAILKDDPPEPDPGLKLPPGLLRILDTCLAKNPAARFHSAHDLAFALEALSSTGSESSRFPKLQAPRFAWLPPALAGAAALLLLLLGLGSLAWVRQWPPFKPAKQPTFTRLTFKPGQIRAARFSPDGREAIFDAAWDGDKPQIYSTRLDTLETRPLGIPGATLLYLTRGGDLGVALNARNDDEDDTIGDLAKAPLGGTAPKPVMTDVLLADLAPDGRLAVATRRNFTATLEFPPGVFQTSLRSGSTVRFSPDGRRLAFSRGRLAILDTGTGEKKALTRPYANLQGFAWKGDEIWFTAGDLGHQQSLRAVTLGGKERVLLETPGRFRLLDVQEDGRALVAQEDYRLGLLRWGAGQERPRDLGLGDSSFLYSLGRDGGQVLFLGRIRHNGKEVQTIFLGPAEGPPQVLNEGAYSVLSPDGTSVATVFPRPSPKVVVYPTGAGQERTFPLPGLQFEGAGSVAWSLDGKALLVQAKESQRQTRVFLLPLDGGPIRPLTPEGTGSADWPSLDLAPDGRHFLANNPASKLSGLGGLGIYDLQNPERPPVPIKASEGSFLGWTSDSKRFYVIFRRTLPLQVWEVDPLTGTRKLFRTFAADSLPGAEVLPWACRLTPDGKVLAVTYYYKPSSLYLVEGLK